ncbi:MAG: hypothetical protein ABIG86_01395 [Patescibacteria group bacterium]
MNDRVVLQIPISSVLRRDAENAAEGFGFSSLQEIVRVFMTKLAGGELDFTFSSQKFLSPKANERYEKIDGDFKNGKNIYKTDTVKGLMNDLT